MMQRIARWLYERLGRYLGEQYLTLPRLDAYLLEYAEVLVADVMDREAMAGEFKRDQVYKALARHFPNMPKCHLSLAIELVYWRLRD